MIAIVAANLIRTRWLQPEEWATWLELVVGVGSMALVVVLVTAHWRATRS